MALRIGCDLDGVLADMEAELVRQAEALFGEAMTRRLEERLAAGSVPADGDPVGAPAADIDESPQKNVPQLATLRMTSRQHRRLWRHVETIENFWEGLKELEPGVIARLASIATERRWEIIFLTK